MTYCFIYQTGKAENELVRTSTDESIGNKSVVVGTSVSQSVFLACNLGKPTEMLQIHNF